MRGVDIETLAGLRKVPNQDSVTIRTLDWLINVHCKELQEQWMTLEEFFESGFKGWCWIVEITREPATLSYFDSDGVFSGTSGLIVFNEEFITHVMPIHKPDLPK